MTAVNSTAYAVAPDRRSNLEGAQRQSQRTSAEPFSRSAKETSSIDGMRRFFNRNKASGPNSDVPVPYVRHHLNAVPTAIVEPSAPPAHLMPQWALQPQHRDPVVPSAPPAHLMPQWALQPQHRDPVLPNGHRPLVRR
ncbi:MAG: hypothetical protein EOP70_13270 [Variovorax sp.]|jgi:hypothetical protein|nr:MAG: hypothetical protein EOP70_13270 [Variovorax sp.]